MYTAASFSNSKGNTFDAGDAGADVFSSFYVVAGDAPDILDR